MQTLRFYAAVAFQSTLPVWGATRDEMRRALLTSVSIHAPRVGSDRLKGQHMDTLDVSIHAPRVGSDWYPCKNDSRVMCFNPRSPCGERLCVAALACKKALFQSTLPVWGATHLCPQPRRSLAQFQSTLPVWGATWRSDCH